MTEVRAALENANIDIVIDDDGLSVPLKCIEDCCQYGSNDEAVAYWVERLLLVAQWRPEWEEAVRETGFDVEDEPARGDTAARYLWIKCWDWYDNLMDSDFVLVVEGTYK